MIPPWVTAHYPRWYNNVMYGVTQRFFRPYLRDRVLRPTLCSKFILRTINKVLIVLSSLSKSISFIKRLRERPRNRFNLGILSLSRATINICLILYTVTPFNRTRFPLIYFFYIYKSVFNLANYFIYNILIVLSVSAIRVTRSVYYSTGIIISLI